MISRIDRPTLYLKVAELFSQRGTCERLRVGAVAVRDKRICCTGYNGTPPGDGHCSKDCDLLKSCKATIHAEANLIASAAKHGISLDGTTLYLTHSPCKKCAELIMQSGIIKVIYNDRYETDDGEGLNLLFKANIANYQYDLEE